MKHFNRMRSILLGLAAGWVLVLVLYASGWAASSQLAIVPTRTPTPWGLRAPAGQEQPISVPSPSNGFDAFGNSTEAMILPGSSQSPGSGETLNCRYGVGAWGAGVEWLSRVGAGWYLDFGAHTPSGPANAEFAQVIYIKQNKSNCTYLSGYEVSPSLTESTLGALVAANPGALWIVGNEPDRGPDPDECVSQQGDIFPGVYAQAYHDVYHFIKQRDATAQVAVAGMVEVTPGRLQYLDRLWQSYQQQFNETMPVDVWNMHLYILPEALPNGQPNGIGSVALGTDLSLAIRESGGDASICSNATDNVYCFAEHDSLAIFAQQIVAMRTWMKQHGQQDKPLILSEYSLLYPFEDYDNPVSPTQCFLQDEYGKCFTSARVTNFMTRTFNYLESATDPVLGYSLDNNRLVQQWLWWSMHYDGAGYVSNLLTGTVPSLTPVGQVFSKTVNGIATYVNLFPVNAANPVAFSAAPGDPVTVTLSVDIRNNGNTWSSVPLTATFYSDAALTQVIGSAVITKSVGGCVRPMVTVTATWANLSSGAYPYWVEIEGDTPRTDDNVTSGVVMVNPQQVYLSAVFRDFVMPNSYKVYLPVVLR